MRLIFALLLTVFVVNADDLDCNSCVHTDDIRLQAVTTEKIAKGAVAEGKLAAEVQQKLRGLVVTDGVGRQLPINISDFTADSAHGYYRLENGDVFPVSIEHRVNGQPHQIYGNSWSLATIGAYVQPVSTVLFTGAGCTGLAYVTSIGDVEPDLLFPFIVLADSAALSRSRLVFRVGDRIDDQSIPQSHMHDLYGCAEADPNSSFPHFPYLSGNDLVRIGNGTIAKLSNPNFIAVSFEGSFRWVPPLKISAP